MVATSDTLGGGTGATTPGSLIQYAPVAAAALALVWHTLHYNFITDDAYISFVYARNFAEHGELTFNLGAPVEGYTNFLWTFLIGVFLAIGVPAEVSSLWLGAGFAIATLGATAFLCRAILPQDNPIAALASGLLAFTAGYACWSSGGLETQMFTFFVTAALCALVAAHRHPRHLRWLGVSLALAAMTRPEGLLVAACIALHRLVSNLMLDRRIRPTTDELRAAAWFLGLWAPWFAWRWWYYGHALPNTYYVKAAGEATAGYAEAMRSNGLHYVWTWARDSHALYVAPLALAGALLHRPRSLAFRVGTLAVALVLVYLLYAIRVGGDFMGLHRFVMPVTVLVAILTTLGVLRLSQIIWPGRSAWLALGLGALLLITHGRAQLALTARSTDPRNLRSDKGIDTPAYLQLYAHDRALIGKHMRDCFRPGDFSIFGGVGAKPFYARAEGIDVFGLVSERIAHEVPRTRPRAGHNKWGPDKLLLEYDPDFVFSCYSLHREPRKPRWNCSPHFWTRRGYEPVTLHIPGLEERGEYYTFLVKTERQFTCPGLVK